VLRDFSVDGVHYVETWADPDPTPYGCGIVLAPWPNRIEGAVWDLNGKTMKLDISDPGNHCAIHGLLRNTSYQPVEVGEAAVTLGASIYPQHGYPFTLDTFVTYRLAADGLHVTHRLVNVGVAAAPFGVGAHPYLRVGDTPVADLTVRLDASEYYLTNEHKVPTGTAPVDGTPFDLREHVRLGNVQLDTAYRGLVARDDRYEATLTAPDGAGLVLWAEEAFSFFQVFTPRDFPGRELAVAVEPMTCPANAFNTGEGLRWLDPGESFEASWGLRPTG
jgi:aldose 1-epimerase